MSSDKLLTFELSPGRDELEVHMSQEGLADLIRYLQRLAESRAPLPRHDHLMAPGWSGNELTEEKQRADAELINKVTLRLWR